MRPTMLLTAIIGLLLAGCVAAPAQNVNPGALNVNLTATERAGVPRENEPVTFGVPLPAGSASDPQKLALLDEQGKAIPASFRAAQWWTPPAGDKQAATKSIRWVHVNCLLSVPAKGTRTLTLTDSPPAGVAAGDAKGTPLKVEGDPKSGKLTVITGPVKLVLSSKTTNVIESASFGGSEVIGGDSAKSGVAAGGKTFSEVDPAMSSIEVLEQSAMKVVVLVKGKFKDSNSVGVAATMPDRDLKAEEGKTAGPGLMFEARITAFSGSPQIAMDYTIINKIGSLPAHKIDLEGLHFGWALKGKLGTVAFGTPYKPQESRPGATAVCISQTSADDFEDLEYIEQSDPDVAPFRAVYTNGEVKKLKPLSLGWANRTSGGDGIAFGVRDFWQTYPKVLGIGCFEGVPYIGIGLFGNPPGLDSRAGLLQYRQELFIGQARTNRITLLFHDGKMPVDKVQNVFVGANVPLMPVAEPAWYCEKTQCWGPIASAGADFGPFAASEKRYNQVLSDAMDKIIRNVEVGLTDRGITQDGYGWLNWGDSFFHGVIDGPKFADQAKNVSWNGNYYDYGMAMIFQFMRTGDWRFADNGLRAGAYTADVFINHWYPDPTRIGMCHYCPPRYHAAIDDGVPHLSEEFNHAKVASVLMRWQMLGDWWARQVMFETFNNALTQAGSDLAGWRQCRGNGHRLHILWCAYQFTGEKKYLDRASDLIRQGIEFIKKNTEFDNRKGQRFMVGIALEGMIEQHWERPDPALLATIKFVADYAVKEQDLQGYTACLAMAYGFLWEQTGDASYLKTALRLIDSTSPNQHAKYFGQTFRSTPYALGYLHEAAAKGVKLPTTRPAGR